MRTPAIIRRIGHRGSCLLFFAILDIVYALNLYNPQPEAQRAVSTRFLAVVLPLPVWAALWLAVGLVCLAGAFVRRDRLAFACASGLKIVWGSTLFFGWLIADVDRGWVGAVIWLAMAGWVHIIASWPEPEPPGFVLPVGDTP